MSPRARAKRTSSRKSPAPSTSTPPSSFRSEVVSGADALAGGEVGSAFARTDLVSNHTVFHDKGLYEGLLHERDLPVAAFSSFIHEATHHWCFISPVGTALSLLYLSIARSALRWISARDHSRITTALDDLLVFDVATSFLRPLNEGLAQFAEYDVVPRHTGDVVSPPLDATLTHLFNLPRRFTEAPDAQWRLAYFRLVEDVDRWRLSRSVIDRKCELLLQPLGPGGSAYLLGYLAVKQIWRRASRFCDALHDADVFLMLVRKLIFCDYALVADLLNRRLPPLDRVSRVADHLRELMRSIWLMAFAEDAPWETWGPELLRPLPPEKGTTGIFIADRAFATPRNQSAVNRGIRRTVRFLREVDEPAVFRIGRHSFPPDFFSNVMRERHLMWIGCVAARWKSSGNRVGRIVVGDGREIIRDFRLTRTRSEDLDKLRLDIYIDLYERYRLTTIGDSRGVFGFAAHHRGRSLRGARVVQLKLDRQQIATVTDVIHAAVRSCAEQTNYYQALEHFWRGVGREVLYDTYADCAFDFDGYAARMLPKRGLSRILGDDPDLVRSIAAISLAASARMSPERLAELCDDPGIDPWAAARRIKKVWRHAEFPLAGIDREGFLRSAL